MSSVTQMLCSVVNGKSAHLATEEYQSPTSLLRSIYQVLEKRHRHNDRDIKTSPRVQENQQPKILIGHYRHTSYSVFLPILFNSSE